MWDSIALILDNCISITLKLVCVLVNINATIQSLVRQTRVSVIKLLQCC